MEHIVLSNYAQADEALNAADAMCDGDPLLINERGVMAFNHGRCVLLDPACRPKVQLEMRT
jgi:anaphase-promoting complex subunit 6